MKEINLGLLGFGVVGTGVARILIENNELISSRTGVKLNLKRIADLDTTTDRGVSLKEGVLVSDAESVISDPDIDIIIEMIGGETIAKEFILKAIDNGKHIVTANKALIASSGNEIFEKALEKGVDFGFEASVGGCMPIVKTLRESLIGNSIGSMTGILNGTCNYILSQITTKGSEFKDALKEAQEKGYAEADPTLDIEGIDTAHKLAILAGISFGMNINLKDVYVEGITEVTPFDIEMARQFGYTIKLLAISKDKGDSVEARVHPTMIPFNNMLSNVQNSMNAINVSADAVGDMVLYGHGAGMLPTASAVISDVVDIARNLASDVKTRIPYLSYQPEKIREIPVLPIEEVSTHYYFRFMAKDSPGVLSSISGILGKHGISIQSVNQKGRKTNGSVPIVMFTHVAKEAMVQKAFEEIKALDIISDKPLLIRIEDEDALEE